MNPELRDQLLHAAVGAMAGASVYLLLSHGEATLAGFVLGTVLAIYREQGQHHRIVPRHAGSRRDTIVCVLACTAGTVLAAHL
jgi:energy-converting hydrogenase Eha subunit B